ncbi:protein piccolo [Lucilia sericata]|uniref:protein piccolo n=1 Tax=Lucilia sericata TaxID=13632 RepID=UPI0018A7EE21|nr:protein piccolo [Lucilia sericata]
MAATLQQHCASNSNTTTRNNNNNTASSPNPQLKRLVYSKYRELLGSYNDQANAYIETLPSYMVHKDKGFNLELKSPEIVIDSLKQQQNGLTNNHHEMYGSGQRMPAQQTYEAPACVQNAMMTKDKKPFTYTPGGIDLSQIKSERMAKRLARNAQAEGATGAQQHNRPTQPQSPGGQASSPNAAASMGAAAMGMPFQVLPPPPPPAPGKNFNGGSAPAPPPPPPSSSNFSNTGTLAPPTNGGGAGAGRGSAPNSPSMPRKSPTPQRFEPPPMGFRPEIKIPPNPMAALRKVPPPVEKNTFWKDEYVRDRSKSPMVEVPNNNSNNIEHNDSVNSASSSPQTTNATNNGTATMNNDNIDGFKKTMPTTTTNNNGLQQNQTNNNYTNYQPQQQQLYTPPTPNQQQQQQQQSPIKPLQQSPQYGGVPQQSPQLSSSPLQTTQMTQQQSSPQQQQTTRPEFRSVAAPTSPAVNIYTRQTDSPRTAENATPPRATESPFKFAQQQQQRAPPAVSPLAQQSTPSSASSGASVSPNNQAQTVPWRTQRSQPQQQQQAPAAVVAQSHPQPIYNNVQAQSQQQQQQQRTPDFSTQQSAYQGPKPTNVGSLYIAPLAPPTEPQAQHIVRQQMQQQQQQRDSPMRQMPAQQQQQPTGPGAPSQQLRWMSTQPLAKEQPAWARPEENGNVVPSSLNRIKSPPPAQTQAQPQGGMYQQQPLNSGNNGFMPQTAPQNFGAQPMNTTGLRLQINSPVNQTNSSQNGPKERIIPIQLEQTPTYTPAQPSFNQAQQQQHFGAGAPAPGYVVRTPNQFVDQGYNNFGQQQQQQQQSQPQRVMSPTLQQLNAPRMVQQTQNNVATGNKTHIIPIAMENNDGTRGPISKTPIVIQNGDYNLVVYDCPLEAEIRFRKNRLSDQRTPPVQSKSFRILQKITDTIDDGSNDDNANQQQQQQQQQQPVEPQLQRPTFARQMSAQQARHSPTVEQMRRMQIGHEQGNYSAPTTPSALKYNQPRSFYDNSQQYIPPSEQQIPEPKKYTGSAIPSRSFKILQAMTQPENADEQENCQNNNEMNEIVSKPESNRHSYASTSSTAEPVSSCSSTSISSELAFSSSPSPTPPPSQPLPYPPYPYPYGYPWYPPPPPPPTHMPGQNSENGVPTNWHYPYPMHSATPPPPPVSSASEQPNPPTHYPPYAYYYPYYPPPPPPHMSPYAPQSNRSSTEPPSEFDLQNMYPSYMPPPPPYLAYPYPVAPSYSQSSSSSRASSVLPDIIITPSTDDVPSQVIMKHHIKVEKEPRNQRAGSIEIEDVTSLKSNPPPKGTVVDILTQHLQNMSKGIENNLNTKRQAKKSYKKNIEQKSPEDNTSPVQITMATESEQDSETETSDSDITPKQMDKKGPAPLKSIRSVNNIQIYNGQKIQQGEEDSSSESESEDDDETTADGESDIFDEEEDEEENHHDFELEEHESETSDSEEFIMDDNLSVIYEEESEMEKSSDMAKTVIRGDRSTQSDDLSLDKDDPPDELQQQIEENDEEDSTSVTVRLPLKFSFSSSKDADNIATVEVGKSQIEEKRSSISLGEKRNSFSVATIKSDSEENDYDDCDVSVTISLTQSSKSNSLEAKVENKNMAELYPIDDMPLPEEALQKIESSQEDVSVSLSLNMRNKFAQETINGGLTNNIALLQETEPVTVPKPAVVASKNVAGSPEEMDFFATLMATKMQAQKIKEQSASYWGKSTESKEETVKESDKPESQENKEQEQTSLESKENKLNFWSNYSESKDSKVKSAKDTEKQEILKEEKPEIKEQEQNSLESKDSKMNFWSKYSQKTKEETSMETMQEETKTVIESKASTNTTSLEPENKTNEESSKSQEEIKKPKFSFWDRCSSIPKEEKKEVKETKAGLDTNFWERYSQNTQKSEKTETQIEVQKPNTNSWNSSSTATQEEKNDVTTAVETKEPTFWERYSKPVAQTETEKPTETESKIDDTKKEEIEDIWAQREEEVVVKQPSFTFWNKPTNTEVNESSSIAPTTEEVVDIWADRVEDLPPIKPTTSKLKSLESAKNSFWSSVSEANKTVEPAKPLPEPESITLVEFNLTVLRSFVKEVPQPQIASVHYEEEIVEETPVPETEETEEIDFWAQIEPARKSPEPKIIVKEPAYYSSFEEQQAPTYINSFGEQECSMYNDDTMTTTAEAFDPLKYPEEPREVDTDEEIDFWAEIEAKHQREDEDDVTFHKSASFWASRERHNSVDETPYKPVLPKAFHAKLPDEPPSADINIWEALEAHKGEEPVIIDPAVEEEKALVQEYDEMAQQEVTEVEEEEHNDDAISVHEPVVAAVWCPPAQVNQVEETQIVEQPEADIWPPPPTEQELAQEMSQAMEEVKPERDELEIKRNNYRKAMAFFTTSIDENKEQSMDRYERSSRINSQRSSCIEEENEKWDWDAVNEALQQDNEEQKVETIEETVAAPIQETFAKEPTPQAIKEETPLPEVYVEPTLKRLPNGLPDLEVNKFAEERKISVKARISAFETGSVEQPSDSRRNSIKNQSLSVESYTRQSSLSRNSSTQRSESEMDEDDSGVTDMNKQLSETDTESESFPELRKMSSYQRAATHSRLFKLLQDDPEVAEANDNADEFQFKPSRRKIVHNVSITRKQNPKALAEAETMTQRRERLSLPLRKNTSIDADNPSTPNSPASPIMGHTANKSSVVSDKLVSELVQSLLLKSDSTHFKKLPMEKLQAAAKRVLEEELDSLENTSVDSTPAMTPNDMKKDKSYADYYNTWSDAQGSEEIVPSKSFRALQDTRRSPWTARCPRVLGSKPINLARVTESPEISMRTSKSPECFRQSRESSIGKWKKS